MFQDVGGVREDGMDRWIVARQTSKMAEEEQKEEQNTKKLGQYLGT